MLHANGDDTKLFHAAHVIHARTGRDVVTFGQGGAGSAEAFVRLPTRAIEGSRCVIFPTIEDPAHREQLARPAASSRREGRRAG